MTGGIGFITEIAANAAFTFRASKHVSIRRMSAPPRISSSACCLYAEFISSNEYALKAESETSGESESDFEVGPMLPATHTFLCRPTEAATASASSAASRAIRAPSYAICPANASQPYSACEITLALKVLVSMISAPAAIYSLCIFLIISGCVRFRHSLFPLSSLEHDESGPEW